MLETLSSCTKCSLHKTRTQVVVADGTVETKIMLVGECPGPDEDRQGIPFIGKAGQLLREVLGTVGIEPTNVYITNLVKCYPFSGLNPSEEHISACSPYLREQISLLRPELIVSLGSHATKYFLGEKIKITQVSGKLFKYNNITLLPEVHPSYVLRGYKSVQEYIVELMPLIRFYHESH